jgi:hypothetical protein
MIDFNQNLYVEDYNFQDTQEIRPATRGDIPTSEEISGIEVRLSKVFIIDNKTRQFGPFPGLATVYLMNIVLTDLGTSEIDLNLNGFEKVDDRQTLAVNRTLFFWKKTEDNQKPPSQIHIMSSLLKSKKGLRDTAAVVAKAKDDSKFKDLTATLGTVLKTASNFSNISNIVFQVAGIVGELLENVEDKPLLTRFQSFTDIGGDFNQLGKTDNPFSNRYAELDYSIFIRDKARQQEAEENKPS